LELLAFFAHHFHVQVEPGCGNGECHCCAAASIWMLGVVFILGGIYVRIDETLERFPLLGTR
jgi:hypothetical protein